MREIPKPTAQDLVNLIEKRGADLPVGQVITDIRQAGYEPAEVISFEVLELGEVTVCENRGVVLPALSKNLWKPQK